MLSQQAKIVPLDGLPAHSSMLSDRSRFYQSVSWMTDRSSLKECLRLEITDLITNPAQI